MTVSLGPLSCWQAATLLYDVKSSVQQRGEDCTSVSTVEDSPVLISWGVGAWAPKASVQAMSLSLLPGWRSRLQTAETCSQVQGVDVLQSGTRICVAYSSPA